MKKSVQNKVTHHMTGNKRGHSKASRAAAFVLAVILILTGTLTMSRPEVHAQNAKPSKLTLSMTKTSTYVGGSVKLKVKTVKPKGASAKVKWTSSNRRIATVSATGMVKGKKAGTVTITAVSKSSKKVKASCKVIVYAKTSTLKLTSSKKVTLKAGEKTTVSAKVTKPKKGAQPVTWSSSNKKVATVTEKGKVTAISAGTAVIVGKSGNKSVKVTISVSGPADVKTDMESGSIKSESAQTTGTAPGAGTGAQTVDTTAAPADSSGFEGASTPSITDGTNPDPANPDGTNPGETEPKELLDAAYTREAWITLLVDRMGYHVDPDNLLHDETTNEVIYSFADSSKAQAPEKLEAALTGGILPPDAAGGQTEKQFGVSEPVTREYAAVTAVRAVGYQDESSISCSDDAALTYANEVHLAVETGMLSLSNNTFSPDVPLTKADGERILSAIDEVLQSRRINTQHEDVVTYNENVLTDFTNVTDYQADVIVDANGEIINRITLPYSDEYLHLLYPDAVPESISANSVSEGTVTDPDCPAIGHVIVLPQTDAYPIGKILIVETAVFDREQKTILLTGSVPEEVSEVYTALDIEGTVLNDTGEMVLGEGVRLVGKDTSGQETLDSAGEDFSGTQGLGFSHEFEFDIKGKELSSNTEASCTVSVGVSLDEINYRLNYSKIHVNEVYLDVHSTTELKASGSIEAAFKKKLFQKGFPLGETGLIANVQFFVTASATGEISFSYSIENVSGVQYQNGHLAKIEQANGTWTPIDMEAEGKVGASIGVDLSFFDFISIYNIRTDVGAALNFEITERSDAMICIDTGAYLYVDLYIGEESESGYDCLLVMILQAFMGTEKCPLKYSFNIITKENSPLRAIWHYEDGKRVPRCTYDNVIERGSWYGFDWILYNDNDLQIYGAYDPEAGGKKWDSATIRARIKTITVDADTSTVTDLTGFFENCLFLEEITFKKFDTSNVSSMQRMFANCQSLKKVDMSSLNTSGVTNMAGMFMDCYELTGFNMGDSNAKLFLLENMFSGCKKLREVNMGSTTLYEKGSYEFTPGYITIVNTSLYHMFYKCESLSEVEWNTFHVDMDNLPSMEQMFYGCSNLRRLNLGDADLHALSEQVKDIFKGCDSLNITDSADSTDGSEGAD